LSSASPTKGYTSIQNQQTVSLDLQHLGYTTMKTNNGLAILGLVLADD
jgi:hypothetical protein